MSVVYWSEDRAVERADEERRECKDIVMLLRRGTGMKYQPLALMWL
jgi:hypothetical protein